MNTLGLGVELGVESSPRQLDNSNGFFDSLPPELRRAGRQVVGQLKRSIPIGKVFGGKVFPPLTF